jgi:cell division protein FtsQ
VWDNPRQVYRASRWLYGLAGLLAAYLLFHAFTGLSFFRLREIDLRGELRHVTREQAELIVRRKLRGNFFTLDMNETKTAFEKLPWVRRAAIRRQWPDTLVVELEEHRVLARWQDGSLVNSFSERFQAAYGEKLTILFGSEEAAPELARRYGEFQRIVAPLKLRVAAVSTSERGAWRIKLGDGMELALGRRDMAQRLRRFVAVYGETVAKYPARVRYADLRYDNGFAVRLLGSAPARGRV